MTGKWNSRERRNPAMTTSPFGTEAKMALAPFLKIIRVDMKKYRRTKIGFTATDERDSNNLGYFRS